MNISPSGRIRAVIFDTDGTLVDSNDYHAAAWVEALAERDVKVGFSRVRALIGMGGDKVVPELMGVEKETPEGSAASERRSEIYTERYLPRVRAFHGTRHLLEALRDRGLKVAVASSAQPEELERMLELAGASDLLHATTSGEDVEGSKPEPDVIEETLRSLGEPPEAVVMVGDTPYDIESARRAGVDTVILRCGGWWGEDDLRGAIACYEDPADLLAHLEESPLAR